MRTPVIVEDALNELVSVSLLFEDGYGTWEIVAEKIDQTCSIIQDFYAEQEESAEELLREELKTVKAKLRCANMQINKLQEAVSPLEF